MQEVAAVYLRQSKDNDDRIDGQRTRCEALVLARGWELGAMYVDNDVSASKDRGADTRWAAMLQAAQRGEFDVLVAKNMDRINRRVEDLVTLRNSGVKRIATLEGDFDLASSWGKLSSTNATAQAEFEADRKGERQKQANQDRVSRGMASSLPRQRPFGFEMDGVTHRPAEAAAIRDAYRALLGGSSLAAIARRWNAAGFSTSRGKPWQSGAVSLVLRNPRYMGVVSYLRKAAGPAIWEAMVDEPTWRTAQSKLRVKSGKRAPGRTLLGQLAECGVCGAHVQGGSNNGRRSYRCSGPKQHLSRKAEDVEGYVEEVMIHRFSQPDAATRFVADGDADAAELADVNERAALLRDRETAFLEEFQLGDLVTPSQLRQTLEPIRAKLAELEEQMNVIRARRTVEFDHFLAAESAADAWAALTMDERRALVGGLATVRLLPARRGIHKFDPETVVIEWRG